MEYSEITFAKGITDRNWDDCEMGQTRLIVLMNNKLVRGDLDKCLPSPPPKK